MGIFYYIEPFSDEMGAAVPDSDKPSNPTPAEVREVCASLAAVQFLC